MKAKQTLPIVLAKDEAAINDFRQRLETLFTDVAQMCDLYYRFPFAATGATPQTIFSNTASQAESYKATHLPETLNVGGMELDRGKFARFMTLPGWDEFLTACDAITARNGQTLLPFFKITDKQVEIDEAKFSQYADTHSIAARTQSDLQLYRAWERMIEGLTEFNSLIKRDFTFMAGLTCPKLAVFLREDKQGSIVPNPQMFQAVAKVLNKKHDHIQ